MMMMIFPALFLLLAQSTFAMNPAMYYWYQHHSSNNNGESSQPYIPPRVSQPQYTPPNVPVSAYFDNARRNQFTIFEPTNPDGLIKLSTTPDFSSGLRYYEVGLKNEALPILSRWRKTWNNFLADDYTMIPYKHLQAFIQCVDHNFNPVGRVVVAVIDQNRPYLLRSGEPIMECNVNVEVVYKGDKKLPVETFIKTADFEAAAGFYQRY